MYLVGFELVMPENKTLNGQSSYFYILAHDRTTWLVEEYDPFPTYYTCS